MVGGFVHGVGECYEPEGSTLGVSASCSFWAIRSRYIPEP
jgi:hypothetical protein